MIDDSRMSVERPFVRDWNLLIRHVSVNDNGEYTCQINTDPIQIKRIRLTVHGKSLCNSYTMGCPPVRGDNPRALASGLSYVQVDKHGKTILYHLHQCRPCT